MRRRRCCNASRRHREPVLVNACDPLWTKAEEEADKAIGLRRDTIGLHERDRPRARGF